MAVPAFAQSGSDPASPFIAKILALAQRNFRPLMMVFFMLGAGAIAAKMERPGPAIGTLLVACLIGVYAVEWVGWA